MEVINDLLGYDNMKIIQNTDMFSFSLDSVLLANFVSLNKNITNVLDIGCGNAPIPLILSTKTSASITINNYANIVESDSFDVITCNPPFFKVNPGSNFNESEYKVIARHEVKLDLNQLFKISRKLLKNGGVVSIVHRPDRLIDIISVMRENNIEPKRLRFIYPKDGRDCNMILVEGSKNGNSGLKILPPLITHNSDGSYTKEVLEYFER